MWIIIVIHTLAVFWAFHNIIIIIALYNLPFQCRPHWFINCTEAYYNFWQICDILTCIQHAWIVKFCTDLTVDFLHWHVFCVRDCRSLNFKYECSRMQIGNLDNYYHFRRLQNVSSANKEPTSHSLSRRSLSQAVPGVDQRLTDSLKKEVDVRLQQLHV